MTKINTLLLLFMLEAMAVLIGLSVYLFIKGRKKTGGGGAAASVSTKNLNAALDDEASRLETENNAIGHDAMVSEEVLIKKEIICAKLHAVKVAVEALKGINSDEAVFWNYFYNDFDIMLGKHFTELMEVTRETMASAQGSNKDSQEEAIRQAQAAATAQKMHKIELLGCKELFEEMAMEFSRIKETNEKVMAAVEELAIESEVIQQAYMDLDKLNKKVDKCIGVVNNGSESLKRKMS